MKTTDMFLSEESRKIGVENTPIVLSVPKMPQGQVFSPHVVSLRGSKGARKLRSHVKDTFISKGISSSGVQGASLEKDENSLFVSKEEDTVLSSIEEMFRGENARVKFSERGDVLGIQANAIDTSEGNGLYNIPSQQEQFQKMRSGKSGGISSWFSGLY